MRVVTYWGVSCVIVVLLTVTVVFAPPGYYPGYQWADRAYAYAETYWDGTYEAEYGPREDDHDCANFCSQIAQAGCAGLGEYNSTNFTADDTTHWIGPLLDCWFYMNIQPGWAPGHDNCDAEWYDDSTDFHRNRNHLVLISATDLSWWFWCSTWDWYQQDADVERWEPVPDWVQEGTFVCYWWNVATYPDTVMTGHMVWIGAGTANAARYWAHSENRRNASLSGLRNSGNQPCWIEVYGARVFSPEEGTEK